MEENCIFEYKSNGTWIFPIYEVKVLETSEGGMISCYEDLYGKPSSKFKIEIDLEKIETIKRVMLAHPEIFKYKEVEISTTLDGISNRFVFAPKKDLTVELRTDNIGTVKMPHMEQYFLEDADHPGSRYPCKAVEVVKVFDEIADVLRSAGVEEKYLRI